MNLFSKYNRLLLIVLTFGLIAIGVLFYQALGYFLNSQLEDSLQEELTEVQDYIRAKNKIPPPPNDLNLNISYKPVSQTGATKNFNDTTYFNTNKKLPEVGRAMKADMVIAGKPLQVTIIESKSAKAKQIQIIFLAIIIPVIILFGVLILLNRYFLAKLWNPFREIMKNIKTFNLNNNNTYQEVETDILEFSELNNAVKKMTAQINDDYSEVKLFTENASHEMMTPIAVINSKLDGMLQSASLTKEDSQALHDLYNATNRLSKINQSLLLLVKIDRNLLDDNEELSVKELILQKAGYYKELIKNRNITINTDLDDVTIIATHYLFNILLNNLFSNAIRHNNNGGQINIRLKNNMLEFENTGADEPLPQAKIFERFYKHPQSEGIGLGLAILKQICNKQGFAISYSYNTPFHRFIIKL